MHSVMPWGHVTFDFKFDICFLAWLYNYVDDVISARAQKVTEWKDRKEAVLRGEITTEETADTGVDSIYEVQEEASGSEYFYIYCDQQLCHRQWLFSVA